MITTILLAVAANILITLGVATWWVNKAIRECEKNVK